MGIAMQKKKQKSAEHAATESLRKIATYTSMGLKWGPLKYLRWFLKTCYPIFTKEDQFRYANVQYFEDESSNYAGSSADWKDWIPTLFESKNVPRKELHQQIAGMMTFLGVLRSNRESGMPFSIKVFTQKFIFEVLRAPEGESDSYPIYDKHSKLLTLSIPDLYDDRVAQEFIDLRKIDIPYFDERSENYRIVDGTRLIEIIDAQRETPEGRRLSRKVKQFFENQTSEIEKYQQALLDELKSNGIEFDSQEARRFITVGFIHAWIKPVPHTYLIPLVSLDPVSGSSRVILFLIGTGRRLPVDKLGLLHVALNMALGYLRERESGSKKASRRPQHEDISMAAEVRDSIANARALSGVDDWRGQEQHGMICRSASMQAFFQRLPEMAAHACDVLVLGEVGTGKRLVAKALHELSDRRNKAFIGKGLAEISQSDLEKELNDCFKRAQGGTLFLNGIDALSLSARQLLLRLLQDQSRDVRVICSSSRKMKNDLFAWFNGCVVETPPLRDRREDIPYLVEYYLDQFGQRLPVQPRVKQKLSEYPWSKRNTRELVEIIVQASLDASDVGEIREEHIDHILYVEERHALDRRQMTILRMLRRNEFNISKTERMLREEVFSVTRKTVAGHCREFCMVMLAKNQWSLEMAVKELAGSVTLRRAAAQKYIDYLFGDKKELGLFHYLERGRPWPAVRKKLAKTMAEFAERYQAGEISPEKWGQMLKLYTGDFLMVPSNGVIAE